MSDSSSSSGISLYGMVFVVFLTLKLTGYITWSWWWVTAPLWGSFLFWFLFSAVIISIAVIIDRK
jgi:hypothetical protein